MRLEGKVAVITGAGTGIGAGTAQRFASEGAKVVLMGRRSQPLEDVAGQIDEASDGETLVVTGDVTRLDDCLRVVDAAVQRWKRVDILVNNAGTGPPHAAPHELAEDDWDLVLDVNLKGYFLMVKAVAPVMLRQGAGSIVNLGSVLSHVAAPGDCAYQASKGGILQLTRSVALDYAKQGIRCNCVCPGAVETPMMTDDLRAEEDRQAWLDLHPIGRLGTPEDVASAILFLASDEASWITGAILAVDGGYTMV